MAAETVLTDLSGTATVCPGGGARLSGISRPPSLTWKGRKLDLSAVNRFGRMHVMFYRTNDLIHSERTEALTEAASPLARELYPDFDRALARLTARHHDDPEIEPIGDVSFHLKLMMDAEELSDLEKQEILAAEAIARAYPKNVGGYNYLDLLLHAIRKDCREAQLVSVADKSDGLCEALHEALAGNTVFWEPVLNYYSQVFSDLPRKYPLIRELFSSDRNPFSLSVCQLFDLFEGGNRSAQPHTRETIAFNTGIPVYEWWKAITIKKFGIGPLINQVEFRQP
jgi:5'-deoxynucleotidase YfbR-like HD superfamily hydrolase